MPTKIRFAEDGYTYQTCVDIEVEECCACGMLFGLDADFAKRRRDDHAWFYCPNGHSQHYTGPTEEQKQRERAERAEAQSARRLAALDQANARTEHERRRVAAMKGVVTKMRRRIASGVCPVPGCHRSGFTRVKAHIAAKHPEWHAEHADELHSVSREES